MRLVAAHAERGSVGVPLVPAAGVLPARSAAVLLSTAARFGLLLRCRVFLRLVWRRLGLGRLVGPRGALSLARRVVGLVVAVLAVPGLALVALAS